MNKLKYAYEIYLEGQSFKDLGLDKYLTSLSVSHLSAKSHAIKKTNKSSGKVRHRRGGSSARTPHEATIKFVNPKQDLTGYFHELDELKIWLGTEQEMFFQGKFLIDKVSMSGSSTENHSIELSLVCKVFEAVRRYVNKSYENKTPEEILTDLSSQIGYTPQFDLDPNMIRDKINYTSPSRESIWTKMADVADEGGYPNMTTEYGAKSKPDVESPSVLHFRTSKFDEALGSDGEPIVFQWGPYRGDNVIVISKYTEKVDVHQATGGKSGAVKDTGKSDSSVAGKGASAPILSGQPNGPVSAVSPRVDNTTKDSSISDTESGVTTPTTRSGTGKQSKSMADTKLANDVIESNKASMDVETIQPVPFLFANFQVTVRGLKTIDGLWDVDKVTHDLTGTSQLKSSVSLYRTKTSDESSKNSGKNKSQGAREGDEELEGGASVPILSGQPNGPTGSVRPRLVKAGT